MVILKILFTPCLTTNTFWKFPWGAGELERLPGAGLVVGLELGNHRREVLTSSPRAQRSSGESECQYTERVSETTPCPWLRGVRLLWPSGPNRCILESPASWSTAAHLCGD